MFEVTCWDSHNRVITGLTQWDINQTLYIKDVYDDFGLTEAPMFHFCNQKSKEALVVQSTIEDDNVIAVKVPNILLQEGIPLIAYMYVYSIPPEQDGDNLSNIVSSASAKTMVTIKLTVKARTKPSQYKYVENIDSLTVAQIEERIKDRLDALETELIESVNSKMFELEELVLELEEWLSKSEISTTGSYVTSELYEVTTDKSGYATLPFILENILINYVFINGLFAVEGRDYQIFDNSIKLTTSEFISGDDIITFVVFKSIINGKTGESKTINISSNIYEAETDEDGYSLLPFTYENQTFQVFINGVLAKKGKDFSIINDNTGIQIVNSEFISGNDIITFVNFQTTENNEDSVNNKQINISLESYETITDDAGCATIPLVPKIINKNYGNTVVQVFINGMHGVIDKDYVIEDGNIQIINTEFSSYNDVVTFIVFEVTNENNNTELIPITEKELDKVCV